MAEEKSKNITFVLIALFVFLFGLYLAKTLPENNSSSISSKNSNTQIDNEAEYAKLALVNYYKDLSSRNYDGALKYHGSGLDYVLTNNPELETQEPADILQYACNEAGYFCLPIKEVISIEKINNQQYNLTANFTDYDGNNFIAPMDVKASDSYESTTYTFTLTKINDKYVVTSPLIYYP